MSDSIVQKLKKIQAGGQNLHQHLKQFVSSLLLSRGNIQHFEAESAQHRLAGPPQESVFKVRQAYSHLRDYQQKNSSLLSRLNQGTEAEPQEPASIGYVPDIQEEARVFEQFGFGFGQEQNFRLFKSLSRFSMKKNAKYLKFWGKIIGTQKDYYIAEGQADGGQDAGELSPQTEPKGTGANKWSFYACNQLSGDWIELPIITPTQLKISRRIKYTFTGDLNRDVQTNPLFPGKESHLLKCQLVRIQTTCNIIPRGSLIVNAETNEIQAPEQYQYPDIATLSQKEHWVYQNASLLKNGRTTLLKPEGLEAEDEEKWVKAQNQLDPTQPKLKNIVLDSEKWSIRGVGIEEVYLPIGRNPKPYSKGVVGIKNLIWPGWITIAYGTKTSSLYVGYGHKYKQNYYPCDPEPVLQENQDREEYVVKE